MKVVAVAPHFITRLVLPTPTSPTSKTSCATNTAHIIRYYLVLSTWISLQMVVTLGPTLARDTGSKVTTVVYSTYTYTYLSACVL